MILRSAKDRFRDGTDIKLIVTAQATVALHYPPTDARRQKFRADFVAVRIPENSEQIRGFEGKLEPRRLKHSGIFICDLRPGEGSRRRDEKHKSDGNAANFRQPALP